jgi:hypothetical protein
MLGPAVLRPAVLGAADDIQASSGASTALEVENSQTGWHGP